MKIIGLDTETTGLSQPEGHRIIEIAFLTYDFASRELEDTWVQRFNPERPIDPGAQEVHGIAYTDVMLCPKWEEFAEEIADRISKVDLLVAHNMDFDGPFIAGELLRAGVAAPSVQSFCTMKSGRWACVDGKFPKLGELCFALGVEYDPSLAHAAEYDVQKTMECFFKGYDRGFYKVAA